MSERNRRNWQKTTDQADGQPVLVSNCPEFQAVVYETYRMDCEDRCEDRTRYGWTASVYWQGEANKLVSSTYHPTVWLAMRSAEEVCEKHSEQDSGSEGALYKQ